MSNFHIHVFYGLNQTTKSADFFQMNECDLVEVEKTLFEVMPTKLCGEFNCHPDSIRAVVRWSRSDGMPCSARYSLIRHGPGHVEVFQSAKNIPPRSRRDGDNLGRRGSSVSRLLAEAPDFSEHQPIFVKPEITEPMRGIIADMLASDGLTPEEAWDRLVGQMRKESV